MNLCQTPIPDAYVIELNQISDDRGFFSRLWCKKTFEHLGLNNNIAQINFSYNETKGTLRGLHFQRDPYREVKIVQCVRGSIFDVIVDLRPDSPAYLEWFGITLQQDDGKLLYVPEGCAHGYQATSDFATAIYPTTEFYHPESESGVRWDDPLLNIEWPVNPIKVSEKDRSWPLLKRPD